MSGPVVTNPANVSWAAPVPVVRIQPSRGWVSLRLDELCGLPPPPLLLLSRMSLYCAASSPWIPYN
jgi:hypothetical protein